MILLLVPLLLAAVSSRAQERLSDVPANYGVVRELLHTYYKKAANNYGHDYDPTTANNDVKNAPCTATDEVCANKNIWGDLFENDIVLTVPQAESLLKETGSWQDLIRSGLRYLEEETCVRFNENPAATGDHLVFIRGQGCWSNVGRVGGGQQVSIGYGCDSRGVVAHETLHALGLWHEQSRTDRDNYIFLNPSAIIRGTEGNFQKRTSQNSDNLGLPYDLGSVMHYASKAFSRDYTTLVSSVFKAMIQNTIQTRDHRYQRTIGQRQFISFKDSKMMNIRYCENVCPVKLPCESSGYTDPNNCSQCKCPPGYAGRYCENVQNASCGGEIIASQYPQSISSGPVETYSNCIWRIKSPHGEKIELNFSKVNFVCRETCSSYVEVKYLRDKLISGARLCCEEQAGMILSEGDEVILTFKGEDDMSPGYQGFDVTYRFFGMGIRPTTTTPETTTSTTTETTATSPIPTTVTTETTATSPIPTTVTTNEPIDPIITTVEPAITSETTPEPKTSIVITVEPTIIPVTTPQPTKFITITAEQTTVPVRSPNPVTSVVITAEPTTLPVTTPEPATSIVITAEPTILPVSTPQPTTSITITAERNTLPVTSPEPVTSVVITAEPTTLPVTIPEPATSIVITAEPTTLHVTTPQPATSIVITAEPTILPVSTPQPTTSITITAEPNTLPVTSPEPVTSVVITAEPTTLPVTTPEPATSIVITAEPNTLPVPTPQPTISITITAEPNTLLVTNPEPVTSVVITAEPNPTSGTIPEPANSILIIGEPINPPESTSEPTSIRVIAPISTDSSMNTNVLPVVVTSKPVITSGLLIIHTEKPLNTSSTMFSNHTPSSTFFSASSRISQAPVSSITAVATLLKSSKHSVVSNKLSKNTFSPITIDTAAISTPSVIPGSSTETTATSLIISILNPMPTLAQSAKKGSTRFPTDSTKVKKNQSEVKITRSSSQNPLRPTTETASGTTTKAIFSVNTLSSFIKASKLPKKRTLSLKKILSSTIASKTAGTSKYLVYSMTSTQQPIVSSIKHAQASSTSENASKVKASQKSTSQKVSLSSTQTTSSQLVPAYSMYPTPTFIRTSKGGTLHPNTKVPTTMIPVSVPILNPQASLVQVPSLNIKSESLVTGRHLLKTYTGTRIPRGRSSMVLSRTTVSIKERSRGEDQQKVNKVVAVVTEGVPPETPEPETTSPEPETGPPLPEIVSPTTLPTVEPPETTTEPYGSGIWSEWTEWSKCSEPCGGCGRRKRIRDCWGEENSCPGYESQVQPCNSQTCVGGKSGHICEGRLLIPCDLASSLHFGTRKATSEGETSFAAAPRPYKSLPLPRTDPVLLNPFVSRDRPQQALPRFKRQSPQRLTNTGRRLLRARAVTPATRNVMELCEKRFTYYCPSRLLTIHIDWLQTKEIQTRQDSPKCCPGYYADGEKCLKNG